MAFKFFLFFFSTFSVFFFTQSIDPQKNLIVSFIQPKPTQIRPIKKIRNIINFSPNVNTKNTLLKHWSVVGYNSLLFNQASYSQWVGGGNNNLGWLASINYMMVYLNENALWENSVILNYGQNNTQGLGTRKTQDVININSNYGYKILDNWYASAGAGILTQFMPGYEGGNDPSKKRISNLMAPAYLNFGLGMTYKKNAIFTLNLRPANIRATFVLDEALQKKGMYGLQKDGDAQLLQFGFLGSAMYDLQIFERVNLVSNAFFYSNYLEKPERIVLSYNALLNMKINKLLTANLSLDLMYDHYQIQKTQLKQSISVGLSYKLDNGVELKKDHFPINIYKKNYSEFFQKRN